MKLNVNIESLKGASNKEIAKELRKELKAQFKNIKFSVTSSIYSIHVTCGDEDFEAHKQEIKEIAGMFAKYTDDMIHLNYSYASYCDTEEYKQERQREYEEQQAELEKERQEREKLYNNNVTIESLNNDNIKVINIEDKEIFVTALEPSLNKNNWKCDNDKYIDESSYINKYKISDIVIMNEEDYNYFCFNLLNDYDFLQNKGGTWSDDETDEVLYNGAVCIYCEGKEPLIIDPQGYSYARYTNRLIEDIDGSLQACIDAELNINDTLYNETLNSISITDLYVYSNGTWTYLDKKIINDNRFIYDDYTSNVIVTGLSYKELLKEGGTKLNLEKLHYNYKMLAKNIIKCETGMVKTLFSKSKLETTFYGIKFSERLLKEIERATEHEPTPEPPKPTKKDDNSHTETAQTNNTNIIAVDFTQAKQTINAEWKEDQATNKQLYALYCITKIKTTGLKINKGKASELITKAKKGKDIKTEIQTLINNQMALAK